MQKNKPKFTIVSTGDIIHFANGMRAQITPMFYTGSTTAFQIMKTFLISLLLVTFLTSQSSYEDSWRECSSCEKKTKNIKNNNN